MNWDFNWKWMLVIGGVFIIILIVIFSLDRTGTIFHGEPEDNTTVTTSIYYFDVGEGQAILIDHGDEEVLIDAGPMGCGIVDMIAPYVKDALDGVVLTSPNKEHVGDLREVLQVYTVSMLWKNTDTSGSGPYVDAMGMMNPDHIMELSHSAIIGTQHIHLDVINTAWGDNLNENSLVLEYTTGAGRFLFMGDACTQTEDRLTSSKLLLKTSVLTMGDHGSDNATTPNLIEAVEPEVAICSGVPSQQMRQRMDYNHIALYSTAESGTICLALSGNSYAVTLANS